MFTTLDNNVLTAYNKILEFNSVLKNIHLNYIIEKFYEF